MTEPAARKAGPALLCIGNATIDEAIQPDGTRSTAPGGDALFAALAARTRIDDVTWLAPVGADFPAGTLDALAAAGLVAAGLGAAGLGAAGLGASSPGPGPTLGRRPEPSVRNVVHYHGDGSRTWDLVHGEQHFEDMSVHPGDLGADLLAADGILISAMGRAAQLELTPWLREHSSATIFLDLQEDYLAGHEQDWLALIPSCDVFLPSEVEAVALSGGTDLERAIRGFAALGPHTVVIKRAGRSCLLLQSADDGQEPDLVEVAVTAVTPVDSTGAGDAFCGAFAAQFLLSGDGAEAVRAGAEAARTAISAPGILGLLAATGVRE